MRDATDAPVLDRAMRRDNSTCSGGMRADRVTAFYDSLLTIVYGLRKAE